MNDYFMDMWFNALHLIHHIHGVNFIFLGHREKQTWGFSGVFNMKHELFTNSIIRCASNTQLCSPWTRRQLIVPLRFWAVVFSYAPWILSNACIINKLRNIWGYLDSQVVSTHSVPVSSYCCNLILYFLSWFLKQMDYLVLPFSWKYTCFLKEC